MSSKSRTKSGGKANPRKKFKSQDEKLNDRNKDGGSHVDATCVLPLPSPPVPSPDVDFDSVGTLQVQGEFIIFCNGINNTRNSALESAKVLSDAFNRKVLLFYNPTDLRQFLAFKKDFDKETTLSLSLSGKIRRLVTKSKEQGINPESIRVFVFCHSHGTHVVQAALLFLTMQDATIKQHIHVVACGGITVISPELADTVQNYFVEEDIVTCFDPRMPKIRLVKRMQKEGRNIEHLKPDFRKLSDSVTFLKGPALIIPEGEPILNSDNFVIASLVKCANILLGVSAHALVSHEFSTYFTLIRRKSKN